MCVYYIKYYLLYKLDNMEKEDKPKKRTAASVLKEFGLSADEAYELLEQIFNELENQEAEEDK